MNFLQNFIENFWHLLNSFSLYLLLGLVFAGVINYFISDSLIEKNLKQETWFSVLKAVLLGIPLTLCSCSVIPFIAALKKRGVPNSSILAFSIATPITGIDSILATYSTFGAWFAFFRVFSSVIIAIFAGILELFFNRKRGNSIVLSKKQEITCISCCKHQNKTDGFHFKDFLDKVKSFSVSVFKDISSSLILGILIGAVISTFMPNFLKKFLLIGHVGSYLLILLLAIPMYVCAISSIPIAASLVMAGISPGAAFIFLTAGPATNSITIDVIRKSLGKKSLLIYIGTVIIGSLLFGFLIDSIFRQYSFPIPIAEKDIKNMKFDVIDNISSVIVIGFSIYFTFFSGKKKNLS